MVTAGGDSYSYDANGNTIGRTGSSGNATWGYDYENRMTSSTTPQGSATFVYNGDGLRIRKTEGGDSFTYDASENTIDRAATSTRLCSSHAIGAR
jgi:YD repeat-containing protein